MKSRKKKLFALLLTGIFLLSCLAGCASGAEQNFEPLVLSGTVTPDSIVIVRGENHLTLTGETVFLKEIEEHPEAVIVNYGWGECSPEKIVLKDDRTPEIFFRAEPASEDMDEANLGYTGYVLITGDYSKDGNGVSSQFSIAKPSLTSLGTAIRDASSTAIELEINNAKFADRVDIGDIELTNAFEGMRVANIQRQSETQLILMLEGEMKNERDDRVSYMEGGVAIKPGSTNAAVRVYGEVPLVTATAYIADAPAFTDVGTLRVSVAAENCKWNDEILASQITLSGAFDKANVKKVEKSTKNPNVMDVTLSILQEDCNGVGTIVFADTSTDAGQPVGADVHFDDIGFYATVKSLEKTEENVTLIISAVSHGLQLNGTLMPKDLTLAGDFEKGTVESIEQDESGALNITLTFSPDVYDSMEGYEGIIYLPVESIESGYANVEQYDAAIYMGAFKDIDQTEIEALPLNVSYDNENSIRLLAAQKPMLVANGDDDVIDNMLCGFITDGLVGLAKTGMGKVGEIAAGKIMSWLGFESSEESMNKRFDQIVDKLDSISSQIGQIEKSIDKLIKAVEASAFKDQMRDVQVNVLKLKPKISGYQAALGEISKLDPGSEEYRKELSVLTGKINNPNGMDFHGETYALGEKIMSDAAGTADGALKSHYDRVTTINNWEQQTYDERERFYLYSIGTYLQAASLDSIALGYAVDTSDSTVDKSEAQSNLKDLKAQIKKVSELAEKYRVKRLKPEYNRNLRTGVILSANVEKVTYDESNPLVSDAEAYRLMQQKLLDSPKVKTRGGDATVTSGTGSFTLPESLAILTEKQALDIMKHSSEESIVQELKSAGFNVPDGCPDTLVTRDIRMEKTWHRGGNSKTYCIDVRYRTVTKGAGEHAFKLMAFSGHKSVWLPHAIDIDPDITKADKSSQFGWRTNPITTASVKQVTDSDNLYVN